MEVAAYSHRGRVRKCNEDYYYIPRSEKDVQNLLIVADGMGGHNAGDVASFMGVNIVVDIIRQASFENADSHSAEETILQALSEANLRIYKMAQQDARYKGMGTTLTMALLLENRAIIGHVGDSRAYMLKDNQLLQITKDHSLVEELVKNGSITKDEALHHPQKHIITRALGTEKYVEIDIFHIDFNPGDVLLLCSDGLVNHVDIEEIRTYLMQPLPCTTITEELVKLAIQRGGNDNITAVVACCRDTEER